MFIRTHGTETTTNITRRLTKYQVCANFTVASAIIVFINCVKGRKKESGKIGCLSLTNKTSNNEMVEFNSKSVKFIR